MGRQHFVLGASFAFREITAVCILDNEESICAIQNGSEPTNYNIFTFSSLCSMYEHNNQTFHIYHNYEFLHAGDCQDNQYDGTCIPDYLNCKKTNATPASTCLAQFNTCNLRRPVDEECESDLFMCGFNRIAYITSKAEDIEHDTDFADNRVFTCLANFTLCNSPAILIPECHSKLVACEKMEITYEIFSYMHQDYNGTFGRNCSKEYIDCATPPGGVRFYKNMLVLTKDALPAPNAPATQLLGLNRIISQLESLRVMALNLQGMKVNVSNLQADWTTASKLPALKRNVSMIPNLLNMTAELQSLKSEVTKLSAMTTNVTQQQSLNRAISLLRSVRNKMSKLQPIKRKISKMQYLIKDIPIVAQLTRMISQQPALKSMTLQMQAMVKRPPYSWEYDSN